MKDDIFVLSGQQKNTRDFLPRKIASILTMLKADPME